MAHCRAHLWIHHRHRDTNIKFNSTKTLPGWRGVKMGRGVLKSSPSIIFSVCVYVNLSARVWRPEDTSAAVFRDRRPPVGPATPPVSPPSTGVSRTHHYSQFPLLLLKRSDQKLESKGVTK